MKLNLTEAKCYEFIILDMASYIRHFQIDGHKCDCQVCERFRANYWDNVENRFKFISHEQ